MTKIGLLVALTASFNAYSKDLGVIGKSYPIIEKDFLDFIHDRIDQKTKSGEVDALNKKLSDMSEGYAKRPTGVQLPRVVEYRAQEIIPQYTLKQDITDAEGNVIYRAGTKVNPLEIKPLSKTLCFIDGDDRAQVDWLKKYCISNPKNKLILVNGDYLKLAAELNTRLYFDQKGSLVSQFGIKAVPAVIRQSGHVLYEEEFPVN